MSDPIKMPKPPRIAEATTPPTAERLVMKIADPEAQAIAKMGAIMTALDANGRRRVLAWLNDRFQDQPAMKMPKQPEPWTPGNEGQP